MHIINYELKRNFKVYLIWAFLVLLMSVYGMVEFSGIKEAGNSIDALMASFPKIVLVIFGMNGLDVSTLIGYYGILFVYIAIMMALYSTNLGYNTTAFEINEKTSDFIYSKPLSRVKITLYKQLVGIIYIALLAICSYLSIILGIELNNLNNSVNDLIIYLNISLLLLGIMFFSIGAVLGALNHKKGSLIANLLLLLFYIIGIIYDLLEHGAWLKWFTPFRYFEINRLLKVGYLDNIYIVLSILVSLILLVMANYILKNKNID